MSATAVPGVDIGAVLVLHAIGDYVIQSDWMAQTKTRRAGIGWWAAFIHAASYTAPFMLLTRDPWALLIIGITHLVIDHWRLARHLIWIKNWASPLTIRRGRGNYEPRVVIESYNPAWRSCRKTGYPDRSPEWLTTWLMFIADNLVHVCINIAALYFAARGWSA